MRPAQGSTSPVSSLMMVDVAGPRRAHQKHEFPVLDRQGNALDGPGAVVVLHLHVF